MADKKSKNQKKVRVGVIGVGFIGRVHLESLSRVPEAKVVAIADIEPVRLAEQAEIFGIKDTYADYKEMLARPDIDAVTVCLPNDMHAPATIDALKAGKHVLCEKPLATSTAEALAMTEAAKAANRALMVAFSHRRRGDVKWLKQAIEDGMLGDLYFGKAMWLRRAGIPFWGEWFTKKEHSGGGPLIDLGVHMLDMALYLMGEPRVVSVNATLFSEFGPRGKGYAGPLPPDARYDVEDLASLYLRLEGGKALTLEASWAGFSKQGDSFGVSLFGDTGGAELFVDFYAENDTLRLFTEMGGVPSEVRPAPVPQHGHTQVMEEFVAVIHSGDWANVTGQDGLNRARIIEAAYRSAKEGREVTIE
ncbi:MAG TPA: Gfo/Idh/MocA family oxidoreductase [Candidatus Limnocylindrales bacterium]|nr:Gfo/Idh/MocA family oxidoreductase [Candidatus Limnocylindrales bacterium]